MKFLALEHENPHATGDQFAPLLPAEAASVWKLVQAGVIRETYFRADRGEAVLMLECETLEAANETLAQMPLVQAGLIEFEIIPLVPYPGFARLFDKTLLSL